MTSPGTCFQCGDVAGWEFVAIVEVDDEGERHAAVRLRGAEGSAIAMPVCVACAEVALGAVLVERGACGFRREDGALGFASRASRWVFHPEAFGRLVTRLALPEGQREPLREAAADLAELRWHPALPALRRAWLTSRVTARGWGKVRDYARDSGGM